MSRPTHTSQSRTTDPSASRYGQQKTQTGCCGPIGSPSKVAPDVWRGQVQMRVSGTQVCDGEGVGLGEGRGLRVAAGRGWAVTVTVGRGSERLMTTVAVGVGAGRGVGVGVRFTA